MTLRDVICFEGLLPGCSFPMETLSLQSFRQSLGDFYEAFVQNVRISRRSERQTNGTSFKCGLKVCEALLELDAWPLCVTIDSSASNHLASFSHGTLIDQMDWMVDLLEFQRRERPKQRDNSFVVVGLRGSCDADTQVGAVSDDERRIRQPAAARDRQLDPIRAARRRLRLLLHDQQPPQLGGEPVLQPWPHLDDAGDESPPPRPSLPSLSRRRANNASSRRESSSCCRRRSRRRSSSLASSATSPCVASWSPTASCSPTVYAWVSGLTSTRTRSSGSSGRPTGWRRCGSCADCGRRRSRWKSLRAIKSPRTTS